MVREIVGMVMTPRPTQAKKENGNGSDDDEDEDDVEVDEANVDEPKRMDFVKVEKRVRTTGGGSTGTIRYCTGQAGIEDAETSAYLMRVNIEKEEALLEKPAAKEEKNPAAWGSEMPDDLVLDKLRAALKKGEQREPLNFIYVSAMVKLNIHRLQI
ncbi:hypothetical protein R1sor_011824 [Riccia sorocarpa]|uniref:Uncharacterized protein n=1 Tax=Riccia sorocarpa TaxID=122646 RepID=A0ABD3I2D8_9MARC